MVNNFWVRMLILCVGVCSKGDMMRTGCVQQTRANSCRLASVACGFSWGFTMAVGVSSPPYEACNELSSATAMQQEHTMKNSVDNKYLRCRCINVCMFLVFVGAHTTFTFLLWILVMFPNAKLCNSCVKCKFSEHNFFRIYKKNVEISKKAVMQRPSQSLFCQVPLSVQY